MSKHSITGWVNIYCALQPFTQWLACQTCPMTAGYYDNWDYYPLSQGKQHSSSPLISSLSTSCYDSDVLWIPGGVILAQREEKEELWAKWMSRDVKLAAWSPGQGSADLSTGRGETTTALTFLGSHWVTLSHSRVLLQDKQVSTQAGECMFRIPGSAQTRMIWWGYLWGRLG